MTTGHILAVDDEPGVRDLCQDVLEADGFAVDVVADPSAALDRLRRHHYDLVLADLSMPSQSGIDLLRGARHLAPDVPFVILTGHPSIEGAVEAVRAGAADFLAKPIDSTRLTAVIHDVLFRTGSRAGHAPDDSLSAASSRLLGHSPAMEDLRRLIDRAAPTESNVLIQGETGTGKERVALALHRRSRRHARPFVTAECAAVSDELLEVELFGRGTGRSPLHTDREAGLLVRADGGTLFLDEIGEMSHRVQAKLLRVIEGGSLPVPGGGRPVPVDLRVVAATPVDLRARVSTGAFREDLFFRLNVIPVEVPPLRARRRDIPVLVDAFIEEVAACRPDPPRCITAEVMDLLMRYPWPGNVRELRNVVERMVSLAVGPDIGVADVPDEIISGDGDVAEPGMGGEAPMEFRRAKRQMVDRFERRYLHRLLSAHGGNVTRAARSSGMKRSAYQRLMRKHGLTSRAYRRPAGRVTP
ncbi:MAG: sigma-54-dependent transcriptional regulator [Acidobacteriota bacterium]